jgi:hypothetical protein
MSATGAESPSASPDIAPRTAARSLARRRTPIGHSVRVPRSRVAAAIEEVLGVAVATPLKEMGYRRRGRHWAAVDGDTVRGVTAQASLGNISSDARFTVEVGVSYLGLGHDAPAAGSWGAAFAHRLSWLTTEPQDSWFAFDVDDQPSVDLAARQLSEAWQSSGQPLAEAMRSPEQLCDYVAACGNEVIALSALERVAVPLADRARQVLLARRAAAGAAARQRWRYVRNDRHALEGALSYWATIMRHFDRLGLDLDADERRAAGDVLADAAAGMLSTRFHDADDEEDALEIAATLGVEPPEFAPIAT